MTVTSLDTLGASIRIFYQSHSILRMSKTDVPGTQKNKLDLPVVGMALGTVYVCLLADHQRLRVRAILMFRSSILRRPLLVLINQKASLFAKDDLVVAKSCLPKAKVAVAVSAGHGGQSILVFNVKGGDKMDPIIGGALLGTGAGIIGGIMQRDAQREANYEARVAADKNAALQKEFAQSGIQWRVEDARKAGIAPLAALGASVSQFAPSYVGGAPETGIGDSIASMGQNLGRAYAATTSKEERAMSALMSAEALRNARLKNTLLESQITAINKPDNPPFPSPMDQSGMGQGNMPVDIQKAKITASQPGNPSQEAGAINDYGYVRTPTGYSIIPSKDVKERIEDQLVPELMWSVRNQMIPFLKGHPAPNPKYYPLPEGATEWRWNPIAQEFRPYFPRDNPISDFYEKAGPTWDKYIEGMQQYRRKGGK